MQRLQHLQSENEELREKLAVANILYQQLLESYNSATQLKSNKSELALLTELHEQEKARLRRQCQQHINSKLQEYTRMADQLGEVRQQLYSMQFKNSGLENVITEKQFHFNQQLEKSQREIEQLNELNRQTKSNQQLAINRLVGRHTNQLTEVRQALAKEHSNQISFYEEFVRRMKETQEKSAQLMRQQLENQQRKNQILEDNGRRLQHLLEEYQQRAYREKEEILERNGRLEGELITLRKLYSEEAARSSTLQNEKSKLQKQLLKLEKQLSKMNDAAVLDKKLTEKSFVKERSLSARLRKQLQLHQSHMRVKEVSDNQQKKQQRLKERQLLESIGNIKRRYEQEHSELMTKLIATERHRNKTHSRQCSKQNFAESPDEPDFGDCPSRILCDMEERRPLDEKELEGSTRHHTFEVADDETTSTNEKKLTTKKRYKHLRINSTVDTAKPDSQCSQLQLDVSTPCFEASLEGSRSKPSKKISIKLHR